MVVIGGVGVGDGEVECRDVVWLLEMTVADGDDD